VAHYSSRTSSILNTTTYRPENSQEIETISADYYREVFDLIPQSALVVDCDTDHFLAVNKAAVELYGYSQEEFHALTLGGLEAEPAEGAAPSAPGAHAHARARRERRHRKKDGTVIQVEVAVRRHVFGGTKAELVVCVDITERKRAEKRAAVFSRLGRRLSVAQTPTEAARIIADAADTLFGWDACVVQLCSEDRQTCRVVLGIDTINGRRREFPARMPAPGPVARRVMEGGAYLELRPQPASFPAGAAPFGDTARPSASLMNVPVRKEANTIGILSIQSYAARAYTPEDLEELQALADHCGGALERIRAEDQIGRLNLELQHHLEEVQLGNTDLERRVRERTAQLEAINKELEAFSHSVSHDLRAPLRSVRGFSEVLLEHYAGKLDGPGPDFLRRIRDSCHDMDNLINDLLKLSRLNQGELHRQVVDLSMLARSIADELSHEQPQRKVRWAIAPALKAQGDERLLRLVLDNLLRNAWKFTGQRVEAEIEFGATTEPQPAFYVRDNGAGFEMEYAGKLFRIFQRLHSAREFPGTGVGLATVQRVINRHGGRVWAVGSPGQGATFYFTLPEEPTLPPPASQTHA
jgi:PAS domain S-box-containing protein